MENEPEAVRQVREWRKQMQASWEGKSPEEIQRELEEVRRAFIRRHGLDEAYVSQRPNEVPERSQPAS